jgi:hypothetical protein
MWLRRRLGCAGRARLRIVEGLRASLGAPQCAPDSVPGWSDAQLAAFTHACELGELAAAVSGRGDAASLAKIAWWGAALADLVPAGNTLARQEAMEIGAAFNLAVALFDSAIDQAPIPRLALVEALAPQRLCARLHHPRDERVQLRSEHPVAARVVGLFDLALSRAGCRYAGQQTNLDELGALLEAMYRSVLGQSDDPFIAKAGPVIFIGAVAAGRAGQALYAALARFCQLWDDALDIAEDLTVLAPNHFLGKGRGLAMHTTLAYVARGSARVLAGAALHGSIERHLHQALQASLTAALACDHETHRRTLRLCRELLS